MHVRHSPKRPEVGTQKAVARATALLEQITLGGELDDGFASDFFGDYFRRRRCWPNPICLASCERAAA
jgi:hypothetical protein